MKTILFFTALALSLCEGKCQSTCGNLDFENGNFDNWKTFTGNTSNIDNINTPSYDPYRFAIMTGGYDSNTGYTVSRVAPGGSYSCRIGNSNSGAEAEKITYSINVTLDNALFIYKYAIVLEDPGHGTEEQPQFEVKILDDNGNITDQTCGYYQVSAAADIPGFQTYLGIVYKDWTTVGIDLTPYIGQTITLCFITKDCSQGGHFGYAYIDAESSKMEIETFACAGNDSIFLSAPYGFDYLWQPGGSTDRVFSVAANEAEDTYNCTLTSVTGCQIVLAASAEIIEVLPDFSFASCDTVRFLSNCLNDSLEIISWNWDFGDGQYGTEENPLHLYDGIGPFDVKLTIMSKSGCTASLTKKVDVLLSPFAIIDPAPVCAGMRGKIKDISERIIPGVTTYLWEFGDGSLSTETAPEKKYEDPGTYSVSLTLYNGPHCKDKAEAEIEIPNCEVQIPNVFTPNSDGTNETFVIKNLDACSEAKLTIFNRWGYPVYSSGQYNNTWNPDNISSGVYYYVFEYSPLYPRDADLAKTGFVTVFR